MGRPFWNVPHPRNPTFTGRKAILADLRKRFTKRNRVAIAQAVYGLGGMGKTQTAVEYAYRYRGKYQSILWLDAESALSTKTGCSDIARRMNLPYSDEDLDQAVRALRGWLEAQTGWLLILDNADDPEMLKRFLPDTENGHILITSRAQDFQDLGILDPVELPKLSLRESTEFLLRRCRRPEIEERDAAQELAHELDGLPLALEQAAAYIHVTKASFRSYIESYRRRGIEILKARGPALGSYPESVVTTWAANFEAVWQKSPASADVLMFSSFLASDDIPFELVGRGSPVLGTLIASNLAGGEEDSLRLHELLQPLAHYSLIRIKGERNTYSLHRLVQEVLKSTMDEPTRRKWSERAVRAVNRVFLPIEYYAWPLCKRLLPHALAVISSLERDVVDVEKRQPMGRRNALVVLTRPEVNIEMGQLINKTAYFLHRKRSVFSG